MSHRQLGDHFACLELIIYLSEVVTSEYEEMVGSAGVSLVNDEVTGSRVNHVLEYGPSFSTLSPLLSAHRRRPHIMRFSSTLNPLSQSNGDVPIAIVSYEGKRKFVLKMESFEVRRARL